MLTAVTTQLLESDQQSACGDEKCTCRLDFQTTRGSITPASCCMRSSACSRVQRRLLDTADTQLAQRMHALVRVLP